MTAEQERAVIVAWLRKRVSGFHSAAKAQGKRVGGLAVGYSAAADAIERGDHLSMAPED